jgi:hypothetical protein
VIEESKEETEAAPAAWVTSPSRHHRCRWTRRRAPSRATIIRRSVALRGLSYSSPAALRRAAVLSFSLMVGRRHTSHRHGGEGYGAGSDPSERKVDAVACGGPQHQTVEGHREDSTMGRRR